MSPRTDRQAFRELVAQVAEKARAALPTAVNGRIEAAVKLVLLHDVMPQADGSILVGSSRDPLQSYLLVGRACECQDFVHGKAPQGWCSHRIAAGIHKRVHELRPPEPAPGGVRNIDTTPAPDTVGTGYTAPLPEAPASVNCHITMAGRQVQLTLRDTDEARLLERLAAVLAQYPVPQPAPQAPPQGQGQDWCQKHSVQMKQTTKDGRAWWSHKTDQGWCKGK
jgi:hypothetical protein